MSRLLIRDLAQIASHQGEALRGRALGAVEVVEHAHVLVGEEGTIESVGPMRELPEIEGDVEEVDGTGLSAIPGLIDCHTHPAFAGDRAYEFALRAGGATYEDLLAAGGGILSTTRATRAAGAAALGEIVARHRDAMLAHGTTTFEGKSGYGLDRDTELAQLEAIVAAGGLPTWLGAHAVPPEQPDADAYVDWAIAEVLPAAAALATAADVFVERGAFGIEPARRYLRACGDAGLVLRLHGDQLSEIGAVPLAIELGARSVDHLEATGPEGVMALARSDVAAVLLPVAALYLARPMPPARALVDQGALVALATDFNPGSAFCESLPVVATLACTQLQLTPEEALGALTVNAAHVLGLPDRGRLAPGLRADIVLLDAPDWRHLAYHLAGDVVHTVVRAGRVVVSRA
ncbi:imidazolonepropionase [Gaiella sp.]|jgi:imidazolonepropionase|uniref:imidazolonepropionase n=1 Tax=Gaiella sp. TaxID=2663207 RepID=UPI002E2FCC00|nr:imidazolonepropionase [Gaiella sp.]HEX5585404.1 imidazolonepropionase [Gaiella sp.]